jgi:hypothetical protein
MKKLQISIDESESTGEVELYLQLEDRYMVRRFSRREWDQLSAGIDKARSQVRPLVRNMIGFGPRAEALIDSLAELLKHALLVEP